MSHQYRGRAFHMLVRNGTNRYNLVIQAIRTATPRNPAVAVRTSERVLYYECLLRSLRDEIRRTGSDSAVITEWSRRR